MIGYIEWLQTCILNIQSIKAVDFNTYGTALYWQVVFLITIAIPILIIFVLLLFPIYKTKSYIKAFKIEFPKCSTSSEKDQVVIKYSRKIARVWRSVFLSVLFFSAPFFWEYIPLILLSIGWLEFVNISMNKLLSKNTCLLSTFFVQTFISEVVVEKQQRLLSE